MRTLLARPLFYALVGLGALALWPSACAPMPVRVSTRPAPYREPPAIDLDDLIANTPADGLIGGLGTVNAELFGPEAARCVAMSYDYTVLAGTQGLQNHRKKDRLFEIAERLRLPIVFATGRR